MLIFDNVDFLNYMAYDFKEPLNESITDISIYIVIPIFFYLTLKNYQVEILSKAYKLK